MDYRKLNLLVIFLIFIACGQFDHKHKGNKREAIQTDKAPQAVASYSQAIKKGNRLYVAGQIGLNPSDRKLVEGLEAQTKQAMENVKSVVEAAGFSMNEIVQCQIFLANIDDYKPVNDIYKTYFSGSLPARAVVAVAAIPLSALIEILVVAEK